MDINALRAKLAARIDELIVQRDEGLGRANFANGAIEECRHLIADLEPEPEVEPVPPAPELVVRPVT